MKSGIIANYHTHTPRCLHAQGTEEAYIHQALEAGYDVLGFSDHTPWPYKSDFVAGMRMPISQLDDYVDTVSRLRTEYADRITILLGLECEAFPEFYSWLREIREEKGLQYLILGNHYDTSDERGGMYFGCCSREKHLLRSMETTIAGMESGLFAYLAHPDLCLNEYPRFDKTAERVCREICAAAEQLDMPLEYNLLGLKRRTRSRGRGIGYTTDEFWQIASEYRVRAIIGADAHMPDALDNLATQKAVREKLTGLGIRVTDRPDGVILPEKMVTVRS